MVDKQQVLDTFHEYFGADDAVVVVHDDGTISVDGWVQSEQMLPNKLPVKFRSVTGTLYLMSGRLTSLEGLPDVITGDLRLRNNLLTDLRGAPNVITGVLNLLDNPLESLVGFPNSVGKVVIHDDPNLPMLRLLNAKEISIHGSRDPTNSVYKILKKYAGEGKRGAIRCQKELIAAGFEGNAKW